MLLNGNKALCSIRFEINKQNEKQKTRETNRNVHYVLIRTVDAAIVIIKIMIFNDAVRFFVNFVKFVSVANNVRLMI